MHCFSPNSTETSKKIRKSKSVDTGEKNAKAHAYLSRIELIDLLAHANWHALARSPKFISRARRFVGPLVQTDRVSIKRRHRGWFLSPSRSVSHIAPRIGSLQRHYRCKKDFSALCAWLKSKGITRSTSRIHTLRKEFGSHIAQRRGIFAASSGLRHSTIGVTRKFYVSSKIEPTSFFSVETPAAAPGQDAAQLVELLKKALEQGAIKLPASQPAA